MNMQFDKKFLIRFIKGQCSGAEEKFFLEWLYNTKYESNRETWLKAVWDDSRRESVPFTREEEQKLLDLLKRLKAENPQAQIRREERKRSFYSLPLFKYAAVILLTILSAVLIYRFSEEAEVVSGQAESIKKETVSGQKRTFRLDDGTQVHLNHESRLIFPASFADSARTVYLEGEAFFIVARDIERPFKVVSGDITTVALGTSFNVRYRQNTKEIVIALTGGNVRVWNHKDSLNMEKVVMEPGEKVTYRYNNRQLVKTRFDYKEVVGWKDGLLYFREDDLAEVVRKLENWYGVTIQLKNAPGIPWDFTGEFKDQNLQNVLKGMSYAKKFKFDIKDKNVIIEFMQPMNKQRAP